MSNGLMFVINNYHASEMLCVRLNKTLSSHIGYSYAPKARLFSPAPRKTSGFRRVNGDQQKSKTRKKKFFTEF